MPVMDVLDGSCIPSLIQPGTPRMPPSSARGSMDHFLIGVIARLEVYPAVYISIPAQAIIKALSVHRLGGGKETLMCEKPRASSIARMT